jgi:hypothetical protein
MDALRNPKGKHHLREAQLIYFNGHEKKRQQQIVLIATAFLSIGLHAKSDDGLLMRAPSISEVSPAGF